ncbi:MAG TPA: calcium/sodium antiporter [archaeon]|nr:calcium/sodium antiporter [archaeon]
MLFTSVFFWIIIFIVCLIGLVKSSDYLTRSAESLGLYIGISAFVVGIVIVSIGTSVPELFSSIFSVTSGASEIVPGLVLGSNIANILLIIGVCAIFAKKIKINYDVLNFDLPLFLASTFLLAIMLFNGIFSFFEGLLCILFIVVYLYYTVKISKQAEKKQVKSPSIQKTIAPLQKTQKPLKALVIFILSAIIIFISSKYLVESVIQLSGLLNIGKEIIAVSALAVGTSLPELVVSITLIKKHKPEMAIGNILGSNIFNAMGIMGIARLFGTVVVPSSIFALIIPLFIISALLYFFMIQDRQITSIEGAALIIFYIFFIGSLFYIV